ncbi:MAG: hypothetical protein LBU42_02410 [Prevotellaceae bacterium]|jgi:hypothetical protein|nr:hypothetical protein [Prevotellaceae bacterium]
MKQLSKQNSPFEGFRGLLLLLLWGVGGLPAAFAQAAVTPLSVDYDHHEVTFRVAWSGTVAPNRVWVWVDLCPVAGTSPGTFAKAVISGATATAGSIDPASLNGRGFYVTANPSTVTATLSNATGQFNWCAYGSDFPPNAKANSSGGYDLKGTPPFMITTTTGSEAVNAYTYSGGTITALTDATGCPGVLCGKDGDAAGMLNCCVTGTTNCNGTCKTNRTYTTNDGTCTGACNTAYVQLRDQCGLLLNTRNGTYTTASCLTGCSATYNALCMSQNPQGELDDSECAAACANAGFKYYNTRRAITQWSCYCCN